MLRGSRRRIARVTALVVTPMPLDADSLAVLLLAEVLTTISGRRFAMVRQREDGATLRAIVA